jgi:hypothetical protein
LIAINLEGFDRVLKGKAMPGAYFDPSVKSLHVDQVEKVFPRGARIAPLQCRAQIFGRLPYRRGNLRSF